MSIVAQSLPVWQLIGPLAAEVALAVIVTDLLQCAIKRARTRRALWQSCLIVLFVFCAIETTGVVRPTLQQLGAYLSSTPDTSKPRQLDEIGHAKRALSSAAASMRRSNPEGFDQRAMEKPLPAFTISAEQSSEDQTKVAVADQEVPLAFRPDANLQPEPGATEASDRTIRGVGLVWLAGSLACFAWLALTQLVLFLVYQQRAPLAEAGLVQILLKLIKRLDLRPEIRVLECEKLKTPVAFGMLRPTIALPKGFTSAFDLRQQEAMLAHELAHLAQGDPFWQFLGKCVAALLWWHPLVWWARRQWHLSSECAADEASAFVTGGPDALAECLLRFGERLAALPALGRLRIGGDGFRSSLGRRVARLLELHGKASVAPRCGPQALFHLFGSFALVIAIVCGSAWATPKIFPTEEFNKGDTVMKTIQQSWQRSMLAVTLAAALGGKPEAILADEASKADATSGTPTSSEPASQTLLEAPSKPVPDPNQSYRGMSPEMLRRYGLSRSPNAGMSPAMLKRYGLAPAPDEAQAANPAGKFVPQPVQTGDDEETIDQTPKPYFLDPVLAARYGLLRPALNANAANAEDATIGQEEAVAQYKQIINDLAKERENWRQLRRRYTDDSPRMKALSQKIAELIRTKRQLEAVNPSLSSTATVDASGQQDSAGRYQEVLRELSEQQAKQAELSKRYKSKYPEMVSAQQEIARLTAEKEELEAANLNARLVVSDQAVPSPASEPQSELEAPKPYFMDPILMRRYGLFRPTAIPTDGVVKAGSSTRAAKGRQAVRAKLEEITLEEVVYDGIPLSEIVKDLKHEATRHDPKKRGINFIINPSSREAGPVGIDPTTSAPLSPPPTDIGSAIIRINQPLKDVRLIDVLDVIRKVSDVPIRYSIEVYGVVFSAAPTQPLGQLMSRTFKVDAVTLTQGLENVAGLAVNQGRPLGRAQSQQTQSQEITELLRQFLASAGVTIDSPNQVFYNDRTGILMVRASDQEQDIVQAAIEMLSGQSAAAGAPENPSRRPAKPRAQILLEDSRLSLEMGQLDEAKTKLNEVLRLEPDNQTAHRELQRLNEVIVAQAQGQAAIQKSSKQRPGPGIGEDAVAPEVERPEQKGQNQQAPPEGLLQNQVFKLNSELKRLEETVEKNRAQLRENPDDPDAQSSLKDAERKRDWAEVNLKWFQTKRTEAVLAHSVDLVDQGNLDEVEVQLREVEPILRQALEKHPENASIETLLDKSQSQLQRIASLRKNGPQSSAPHESRDAVPDINTKQLPRRVSVIGRVMKAGPVRLPEDEKMDIIQAVAQAGGFQPTANQNKIELTRNGESRTYRFKDLKKITENSRKVWLEPGDVIEVKESVF